VKNVGGGTAWVDIGATATGSPAGSVTTTAPSTNFMSFSFFTLANLTGGTNPLPVELIDFSAKLDGDVVKLNWSTASELNNDFFAVERATDLEHFGEIENIPGSGTTKEVNHYEAIDPYPHYGRSYYRLRQTDLDGNFSYSDLEVVDYDGPRFTTIKAYPNPTSGDIVTVEIVGLKKQRSVPVQVFDVKGQKVYEKIWEVTTPGSIHQDIEFESPLRQGLYIMRAGKTLQLTERIIVD
jgi:hypothetical protein